MKTGLLIFLVLTMAVLGLLWQNQCRQVVYQPVLGWAASSEVAMEPIPHAEDPDAWSTYADGPAQVAFDRVQGRTGAALRISYSLVDQVGNWAGGSLPFDRPLPESARIGFWIRSQGLPNNLEIKLVDAAGGCFMRTIVNATATSDWKRMEFDLREVRYVWGGTNKTLGRPVKFEWTVARGYGSVNGGSGWVELEGLCLVGANPRLEMSIGQVGFDPDSPKRAVLRLVNAPAAWTNGLLPRVKLVPKGWSMGLLGAKVADRGLHSWGGRYWVADFSRWKWPGKYELVAELDTPAGALKLRSYPFEIGSKVVARRTARSQFNYIRNTRYPTNHPHADPVPGGYYDTEFDIEKWMTTTPTWVWGMARFLRCFPDLPGHDGYDPLDELEYATDFMLAMQNPEHGGVYVAVNAVNQNNGAPWPGDVTVETDTWPRTLTRNYGLDVNTAYAGAMAEAAMALTNSDPARAAACLNAAVRAWRWCLEQKPSMTQDVGDLLWASMRLHEATGDGEYLRCARELAEKILPRQFRDSQRGQDGVCGRFFRTDEAKDFNYQYKYVHSVGIELGLLELAGALPADDPLRARLIEAMRLYVNAFLAKTAAGTPYGVVAQGLEPDAASGLFKVYYFALSRYFGCSHGLNCDIMSSGLVALRFGRLVGEPAYADLAWEQLQWVLGKNPFGFCMITGIGTANPFTMTHPWKNKGPIFGGLINGIIGTEDLGMPSYDVIWGSSEYWKPHNAMFLALVAELEGTPPGQ